MKKLIITMLILCAIALGFYGVKSYREYSKYHQEGLTRGNGRLEATEVAIATKLTGRIQEIYVNEGDLVKVGDKLALMQLNVLNAELAQAQAQVAEANAQVAVKNSELDSAKATLQQKQSSFEGAKKRYERGLELKKNNAISEQSFENDETHYLSCQAEVSAAKAKVQQAEAELKAAEAQVQVAQAQVASVQEDINDSLLSAPCRGRIQYRVAEPGEVLQSGASVLNLVDLTDVYMTFFLPETLAGQVKIGAEARIVLDARTDVPIPATITFVSSVAQFTPKTVETQEERQKLMFRIKAKVDPQLLEEYIDYVKTGLPGEVWVKLDDKAQWPEFLKTRRERGIPLK